MNNIVLTKKELRELNAISERDRILATQNYVNEAIQNIGQGATGATGPTGPIGPTGPAATGGAASSDPLILTPPQTIYSAIADSYLVNGPLKTAVIADGDTNVPLALVNYTVGSNKTGAFTIQVHFELDNGTDYLCKGFTINCAYVNGPSFLGTQLMGTQVSASTNNLSSFAINTLNFPVIVDASTVQYGVNLSSVNSLVGPYNVKIKCLISDPNGGGVGGIQFL